MNDLIEKLSNLRSQFNCFDENERDAYHTLSEAIKVISERPEPCEDAVSRQAVLDLIADYDLSMGQVVRGIHVLPSAQPEYTCVGCKHRGKWENEVEYGYASPCTICRRRTNDNYEQEGK